MGGSSPGTRKCWIAYEIPYEENRHTEKLILNAGLIIKSPGIPESSTIIQLHQEERS